jgi:hypothetical protein
VCAYLSNVWSQADTEHIATKLEESLNLKDEEKQGEATEEQTGKAAPPAASTPEPTTAVEEPHAPNDAPQEEEKEDDAGDSRQHLNVVFIGHVGTDLVPASSPGSLGIAGSISVRRSTYVKV